MAGDFTLKGLTRLLGEKVAETQQEPDFQKGEGPRFATGADGEPLVKVAAGNIPIDYDLWEGLRNPAMVGMFPAGLAEIWEFQAKRKQKEAEAAGQAAPQIPASFDYALANYRRAVIASVMLPFSSAIVHDYVREVIRDTQNVSTRFAAMHVELGRLLDKALVKAAADLAAANPDAVVVPMNGETIRTISTEVIPQTHQGLSHGVSKGGNYAQKSVAVLMGLGQFGVSRLVIRDEADNGRVLRYAGPIRSLVIFDKNNVVADGNDGVIYPSSAWRQFLMRLFDFTSTDPEINQYRFCSHINPEDRSCTQCIDICVTSAQAASTPDFAGQYSGDIVQKGRFWQDKLQFEFEKCRDQQAQIRKSTPDWFCGKCVTVCVDRGIRRKSATQSFYDKMHELAVKPGSVPVAAGS